MSCINAFSFSKLDQGLFIRGINLSANSAAMCWRILIAFCPVNAIPSVLLSKATLNIKYSASTTLIIISLEGSINFIISCKAFSNNLLFLFA